MTNKMQLFTILGFAVLLFLTGCSESINGKPIAEAQIDIFHDQINANSFAEIYESAHQDFQSNTSKEITDKLFAAIRRKLGRVESFETINWSVNTHNTVTTVVLVSKTKFTDGEASETFTYRVDGEQASLIGYNINSLDMLIR